MRHIFFSKNCANTETQNIYAIRILNEENFLPTLLKLAVEPYKNQFPLATSTPGYRDLGFWYTKVRASLKRFSRTLYTT